jgi:hypothetical protein
MNAVIDNLVALAEHWSSKAMSAREQVTIRRMSSPAV